MSTSYYVETGSMENTGLDREVRFATRAEAERALAVLVSWTTENDRRGSEPSVEESNEPANTTFDEWNERAA